MLQSCANSLLLLLGLALQTGAQDPAAAVKAEDPNAAQAEVSTVKSQDAVVYSRTSLSADSVKTLHQGDRVIVDFEVASFYSFCKIREMNQEAVSGFVLCDDLERPRRTAQTNWAPVSKNKTRATPPKKKMQVTTPKNTIRVAPVVPY